MTLLIVAMRMPGMTPPAVDGGADVCGAVEGGAVVGGVLDGCGPTPAGLVVGEVIVGGVAVGAVVVGPCVVAPLSDVAGCDERMTVVGGPGDVGAAYGDPPEPAWTRGSRPITITTAPSTAMAVCRFRLSIGGTAMPLADNPVPTMPAAMKIAPSATRETITTARRIP